MAEEAAKRVRKLVLSWSGAHSAPESISEIRARVGMGAQAFGCSSTSLLLSFSAIFGQFSAVFRPVLCSFQPQTGQERRAEVPGQEFMDWILSSLKP